MVSLYNTAYQTQCLYSTCHLQTSSDLLFKPMCIYTVRSHSMSTNLLLPKVAVVQSFDLMVLLAPVPVIGPFC